MTTTHRVLPATPFASLAEYESVHGGAALEAARAVDPNALIDEIDASGLRGRGGAGFPTGRKWRTVAAMRSERAPTTVIVNGAEGEPGTFKDRAILRANPYQVIEGALIAAVAVGAPEVVFAVKASAVTNERLRAAIDEVRSAGWIGALRLRVFEGPSEYLYGEETALLEVLDGGQPFPRVTPPFREGIDADLIEVPALVDNVETLANVPGIVRNGAEWFRNVGTDASPGTIVCTVSGGTQRAAVGEFAMGTPLREVIAVLGGDRAGRPVKAVMPGVSAALLPATDLDVELTYEAMAQAGSGLGSAGFIVVNDEDDVVAAVAGASRFLAVESCGQCTPCKVDGLQLAALLERVTRNEASADDVNTIRDRLETVADGARCSLARQHEAVVRALFDHFGDDVADHIDATAAAAQPSLTAEVIDISYGTATLDVGRESKQPDWTYGDHDSGKTPVERFMEPSVR